MQHQQLQKHAASAPQLVPPCTSPSHVHHTDLKCFGMG